MKFTELKLADFTKKNLTLLKELEQIAYSGTTYPEMQNCETWEDVANYCDCEISQLKLYLTNDWYLLFAEHDDYIEIVDLASKISHTPLFLIINKLTSYQKPFIMDCRDTTSYRIIKALEKAGKILITVDDAYERGGEVFHDIKLEVQNKQKLSM